MSYELRCTNSLAPQLKTPILKVSEFWCHKKRTHLNKQLLKIWTPSVLLSVFNALKTPFKGSMEQFKSKENRNVEPKDRESNQMVIITINREFD